MQSSLSQLTNSTNPSSAQDRDNLLVMDEHGLLQSFVHRRRRMEAAMRLANTMLGQVTSITETDEGSPYLLLFEGMGSTDGAPTKAAITKERMSLIETRSGISGAGESTSPPEAMLDQEVNEKLKRLREMRSEQRRAAEMQVKPAFELAERMTDAPAPPTQFTSTSLAFSLETLAKNVSKIIAATDAILVQLSILDKTKSPSIFNEMHTLSSHSQHAFTCYSAALQHLKQYEVCQKALQDGTAEELSNRREQFLMRKEMLTAQEQKQKVVEEHLQAMKLRLNAIDARCRMWSTLLLEIPSSPISPSPGLSGARISLVYDREGVLPRSPTMSRPVSNTHRGSMAGSLSLPGSTTRPHTPMFPPSSDSSDSSTCTSDEFEGRMEAMEVKVAQFWTNPYVVKAQRCTDRRRHLRRFMGAKTPPLADIAAASIAGVPITTGSANAIAMHTPMSSRRESLRLPRNELPRPVNAHDLAGRAVAETRLAVLLRTIVAAMSRMAAGTTETEKNNNGDSKSEINEKRGSVESGKSVSSGTVSAEGHGAARLSQDVMVGASVTDEVLLPTTTLQQEELDAVMESSRNLLRFLDAGRLISM
ncbi:hypothetical protein LSM04_007757 [Trypanosoma melophagium]|uniref:uncharacterized protein n=1 Tax=Trypanosoma melophagium TaxID=715481 RepID=UPI00351AABEC|nr:hypothetical protein LSM04_007757 [Trypanosoma melophagium]